MPIEKIAFISKECVACGNCVKICPLGAMRIHNGIIAEADEEKCVGCGKCVIGCPACVVSVTVKEEVGYEEALV